MTCNPTFEEIEDLQRLIEAIDFSPDKPEQAGYFVYSEKEDSFWWIGLEDVEEI